MLVPEENGGDVSLDSSDQDTVITKREGGGDEAVKSKFRNSRLAVRTFFSVLAEPGSSADLGL